MTCYFNLIGRMGNILFIYCHARAYCEKNGFDLCLHPWVGEQIFKIQHAVRPPRNGRPDISMPEDTCQRQECLIYTRKQVRDWLQIRDDVRERLAPVLENRRPVLLDQRAGTDYHAAGLVSLGQQCYLDAAAKFGYTPDQCEWEIDTSPTRLPAFQGDVTASGYNTTWVSLPALYKFISAKVHFRAPSSFSWWGAVLGDATVYSPIIKGVRGGVPGAYAEFVEGNWPVMADCAQNSDLHLQPE